VGTYAAENQPAGRQQIPTFRCPSFGGSSRSWEDEAFVGITNYAACHHDSEAPIDANNNGVMYLNSRLPFVDIRDGTSNTILIGETLPATNTLGWASGTKATLRNTGVFRGPPKDLRDSSPLLLDTIGTLEVGGFSSYHIGGANFTFADGSIRFLSINIDSNLLRKLGNRADGEMLEDRSTQMW